jgi:5-keto 4-deoxyuronate isomerase
VDHVDPSVEGGVDVLSDNPSKAADVGRKAFGSHHLHRLEIAARRYGKTGLDDVDAELVELPSDDDLLFRGQGDAGGLFTIPEGGVEDPNLFSTKRFDVIENDPTQIALAP